jgi:hypothetical protein
MFNAHTESTFIPPVNAVEGEALLWIGPIKTGILKSRE